jgi:hypothetical protein
MGVMYTSTIVGLAVAYSFAYGTLDRADRVYNAFDAVLQGRGWGAQVRSGSTVGSSGDYAIEVYFHTVEHTVKYADAVRNQLDTILVITK